jgi:hypothetical protein
MEHFPSGVVTITSNPPAGDGLKEKTMWNVFSPSTRIFKGIPYRSEAIILTEPDDVAAAPGECEWMLSVWKNKDVQGVYRKFED